MPRYIDADKVVKWSYSEPRYSDSVNDRTDLRDFLLSLPTVSTDEVRGVVHCKECKHTERDGTDDPAIYCKVWDRWEMPEDGFCYKGAKMEVTSDA